MLGGEPFANLLRRGGALKIGGDGVVGCGDFLLQPLLDGMVAGEQGAESVADDFALAGVFPGLDAGAKRVGHVVGERDAELSRCPHVDIAGRAAVRLRPAGSGDLRCFDPNATPRAVKKSPTALAISWWPSLAIEPHFIPEQASQQCRGAYPTIRRGAGSRGAGTALMTLTLRTFDPGRVVGGSLA